MTDGKTDRQMDGQRRLQYSRPFLKLTIFPVIFKGSALKRASCYTFVVFCCGAIVWTVVCNCGISYFLSQMRTMRISLYLVA